MEESLKNRLILILAILTTIFFVSTIGSCSNARRLKTLRDKEMANRLDREERLSKLERDKAAVDLKLNTLSQALEEEKAARQTTQKNLEQEQLVNQSLKDELQKVTKLKEALEEDLKEALVAGKSAKSKK